MTQVHRIVGVLVVCLMLFASIDGAAHAQSEGGQQGTDTQQGGGKPAPPRDDPAPTPTPKPKPTPAPQPQQPPSSEQPSQGGGNAAPTTGQGGQQGPTQPKPNPTPPPSSNNGGGSGGGSGQLSILIDLSDQRLYAYEGSTQVLSSYINSGKWGFETPTGTFYVNSKYRYDDMSGCEGGECWDVPDVPYAMYFTNRGHAIHGAYWTSNFGNPASHGCVNLPVSVAGQLFNMTSIGTKVVIRW